jgi:ankyrin repeat protein
MYVATYHEDKACIDLIELLVSHGAQLNMLNPSGESILHLLIEQKQFDVAIYLIRKYPTLAINSITKKGENALKICARLGDSSLKAVKALLGTERINVNSSKGLKGRTALHLAAENGSKEIVDLLLKHKADVNCKDLNVSYSEC